MARTIHTEIEVNHKTVTITRPVRDTRYRIHIQNIGVLRESPSGIPVRFSREMLENLRAAIDEALVPLPPSPSP